MESVTNMLQCWQSFVGVTNKAVRLQVKDTGPTWIPRSCVHGGDDRELDRLEPNQEISIRIMEWVARKNGLVE